MSLSRARMGEMTIVELLDENFVIGTRYQCEMIPIKNIMDKPLRTVSFTIDKVESSKDSHQNTQSHMDQTIFYWSEGLLVILKDQLKKCH